MSIVQGGSGIPVFHSSVYQYMCKGTYLGLVDDDMAIPDREVQTLLTEVSYTGCKWCNAYNAWYKLQISDVDSDDKLRSVFVDDDKTALVYETGYTMALCQVTMADKDGLKNALRDYHSLITIKAELDQLSEGLHTCEVLTYMQNTLI